MNFLKRILTTKLEKDLLNEINNASTYYNDPSLKILTDDIVKSAITRPREFKVFFHDQNTPMSTWVHVAILTCSQSHLRTGNYHLHRGVLNPMTEGESFLNIFHKSVDKLIELKYFNEEDAKAVREIMEVDINEAG